MQMSQQGRIPFFFFKDVEHGEDREASEELGYPVPAMKTFIYIIPHGHRGDAMEFEANEFIKRKKKEAMQGAYDLDWAKEYEKGLALHKEGKELPREGTPLATWERLLKSRRELLAKSFPTVEDLAAVPDSALDSIGMDGRVLRDLARGDIQAKKDLSPIVKELAEANENNRRLIDRINQMQEQIDALAKDDDKPRRGRPPTNQTE